MAHMMWNRRRKRTPRRVSDSRSGAGSALRRRASPAPRGSALRPGCGPASRPGGGDRTAGAPGPAGSTRRSSGGRRAGRRRSTYPLSSSSLTVWAIDCGRIFAPAARSLMLCGPSRSSAPSAAPWPIGNPCSARTRRKIWPSATRSSAASSPMFSVLVHQEDCTGYLYTLAECSTSGSRSRTPRSRVLLATLDASITLIAMPDIFRGIQLDPLVPGEQLLPAVDDPRLPGRHRAC